MKNNKEKGLGALISAPDNRRIAVARVQANVVRPTQYYFDDSKIPTEDQKQNGSCVGQAEGGELECREYLDTKKVTPVSKRWIYAQCKKIDGLGSEGTYPTLGANIMVQRGAPKKEYCEDNNSLPHSEFIKIPEDSLEVKEDAAIRVAAGYAFVSNNLEEILQTIFQKGTYTATLQVGNWNEMPVQPTPSRGSHRIRFNGYREIPNDAMIWFRNSWGLRWASVRRDIKLNDEEKAKVARGDGFFLFSEYMNYLWEQIVYTDVPYALIMEAKNKRYIFNRDLQYRSTGTDVMELQKRLVKEIAFDGFPCFRYPNTQAQQYTTYFGRETEKAVQRYQEKNKIAKTGQAGYGRFGPRTRVIINQLAGVSGTAPLVHVARKIVLNAGHYNGDPGAIGNGTREADETKIIRDHTATALRLAGFEVFLIGDERTLIQSIADANKLAPKLDDALCIDIHLNSSNDKSARGVEAFYGTSDTSKMIASLISLRVSESLGMKNRGGKPDTASAVKPLGWIRQTKAWATLVEVGFISSPEDMAILRNEAGYKKAADGITNAVMELFGVTAPTPPAPSKPSLNDGRKLIQEGLNILNLL